MPSMHTPWQPRDILLINMTPAELKTVRLRLGFRSRRALAEEIEVPKQTIDSWESGRRPIPNWLPKFMECLERS